MKSLRRQRDEKAVERRRSILNYSRKHARTLVTEACSPFDQPEVRNILARIQQQSEQTIDVTTIDVITGKGVDAQAKEKAEATVRSFRDYIEQHKAEIEALQILYSRPFKKRLTEESLRELEAKLKTRVSGRIRFQNCGLPSRKSAIRNVRSATPRHVGSPTSSL